MYPLVFEESRQRCVVPSFNDPNQIVGSTASPNAWLSGVHRCDGGMRGCDSLIASSLLHAISCTSSRASKCSVVVREMLARVGNRVCAGIARGWENHAFASTSRPFIVFGQPPGNLLQEPARGGVCTDVVLVPRGAVKDHRVRPATPPASPGARRQRRFHERNPHPTGLRSPAPTA